MICVAVSDWDRMKDPVAPIIATLIPFSAEVVLVSPYGEVGVRMQLHQYAHATRDETPVFDLLSVRIDMIFCWDCRLMTL